MGLAELRPLDQYAADCSYNSMCGCRVDLPESPAPVADLHLLVQQAAKEYIWIADLLPGWMKAAGPTCENTFQHSLRWVRAVHELVVAKFRDAYRDPRWRHFPCLVFSLAQ